MRTVKDRYKRWITLLIVVLLINLLAAGGFWAHRVAYATIPDAGGVIHACYDSGNQLLRVIDTEEGDACRSQEKALSWNETGPQGPVGPRGPSDGYVTNLLPSDAVRLGSSDLNVLSLSLPAGDYILTASVQVQRSQAGVSTALCDFRVGGGPFPTGYAETLNGADAEATISATSGISLTSDGMVHVTCLAFGVEGTFAALGDLTAIRVGKVTRQ